MTEIIVAAAPLQPALNGRLDTNPAAVYLSSLSPGSKRTMRQALDTIAQIVAGDELATAADVPWRQLRFQHTAAIRAALADRYAHSTANKMLSALRGVLKASWQLGQMSAEDYQAAAAVGNVRGETLPAGRMLIAGELGQLLATCSGDQVGIRDRAIITVLYVCGVRRAELVQLDLADYQNDVLKVKGKRNKQRLVPMATSATPALAAWLAARGSRAGPLFVGLGNRNVGGRLSTQAIYEMLRRRARQAGIEHLSPHDFRRTFVSDLLDAEGVDIVTVQKLAGHASVETTARYDRRGEETKRRAVEHLRMPLDAQP